MATALSTLGKLFPPMCLQSRTSIKDWQVVEVMWSAYLSLAWEQFCKIPGITMRIPRECDRRLRLSQRTDGSRADLFVWFICFSTSYEMGWEECIEWDVKAQLNQSTYISLCVSV